VRIGFASEGLRRGGGTIRRGSREKRPGGSHPCGRGTVQLFKAGPTSPSLWVIPSAGKNVVVARRPKGEKPRAKGEASAQDNSYSSSGKKKKTAAYVREKREGKLEGERKRNIIDFERGGGKSKTQRKNLSGT